MTLSADQAREQAKSGREQNIFAEKCFVMKQIDEQSKRGVFEVFVPSVFPETEEFLKEMGYSVNNEFGCGIGSHKISWK